MRQLVCHNNIHLKPANWRTIEMDVLESAPQFATAPKTEKLAHRDLGVSLAAAFSGIAATMSVAIRRHRVDGDADSLVGMVPSLGELVCGLFRERLRQAE
jgi:hypothetical protein